MIFDLRVLLRQLRRSFFFTILKVSGLAIGFTVFVVLLSMVRKELSYDRFWETKGKLYRVALEQHQEEGLKIRSARNFTALSALLEQEFPEVEARLRLHRDLITVFAGEEQIQDVEMFYCDTNFFELFPRRIIHRESSFLFPDIHSTVISSSLAMSLYGTTDVVGREISLNEGWKFWVSGVFEDIPENSHINIDMLLNMASMYYYSDNFNNSTGMLEDDPSFEFREPEPYSRRAWENNLMYSYVLVREGVDIENLRSKSEALVSKLELSDRLEKAKLRLIFQPVNEIHLRSDFPDEIKANSNMFRVYMMTLIGFIVLVVSWINFMNLFVADFHERRFDVAIRVIHGADRRHIHAMILQKGLLISLIAGVLTWVFIRILIQVLNNNIFYDGIDLVVITGLVIISTLLTILIPMASFQSSQTMAYLKREVFVKMKGLDYRRVFVIVQFAASIILISCTIVIFFQMEYTWKKDLGFDMENIIYSFSPMTMNQRPEIPQKLIMFRDRMSGIPGVKNVSVSSSIPGKPYLYTGINVRHQTGVVESDYYVMSLHIDPWYIETFGIKLLAGDNFRKDHQYPGDNVLLNRKAARLMGFKEPEAALGEFIRSGNRQYQVVGIVEDYHHQSLQSELMPVVFFKSIDWRYSVGFYSLKLSSYDQTTIDQIARTWRDIYPGEQYIYKSLESTYLEQYSAEQDFARSFMIAALLAIMISCLGLLGMAKYNAMKRTREIGLRKAFGATSVQVLKLLQSEILLQVFLSSLLGSPIAWFIMKQWLNKFAFRIDTIWWMYVLGMLITLLIATFTIFFHTWKVARTNPVESLRYE